MENLIKELKGMQPTKEQLEGRTPEYAFGYVDALNKAVQLVKDYDLLHNVSNQRELLLSAICQFTNRNTQKEILEVDEWLKTDYRK